jgi:NAD-dependent deacetylase
MSDHLVKQAASLIRSASHVVALTGAGVSTPSGIPDFRSPDSGLWTVMDPLAVASIWGFHAHPEVFYRWFMPLARQIREAQPNRAHLALAEMEQAGHLNLLLTQNIDGLHQSAGSQHVVELHGHLRSATCLDCGARAVLEEAWRQVQDGQVPRCRHCNGLVKPDATLFGEPLDYESLKAAQQAALRCDVLLVAGSSLEVEPAADLPHLARRRGAHVVLVNRQPTLADAIAEVIIRGDVATVLPNLVTALR